MSVALPEELAFGGARPLNGTLRLPGDKSISHRALIFGAMAVGETRISGLLEGQDVLDTASAMRAFGATVLQHGPGAWSVQGVGVGGFQEPADVIDCGNSGTGVRLIMGTMATSPITATFTGPLRPARCPPTPSPTACVRGRPAAVIKVRAA